MNKFTPGLEEMTDKGELKALMLKLLKGKPVELTDSAPETYYVRELLEQEGVWKDGEHEYDFGGAVYWSKDKTTALIYF